MSEKINNTILAYLLALQDFPDTLSDHEQENLKKVAKDLKMQPKAWKSHIEPSLIQTIQGNSQLNQSYQLYREKLDRLGEIPLDLLPKAEEINQLVTNQSTLVSRGLPPNPKITSSEEQLNNLVIIVNQTDKPEETVKQVGLFDKVKQWLD